MKRHAFAVAGFLGALASTQGCEAELDFEAKAGESCEYCSDCSRPPLHINSCICDTCTEYAFDHETNELLWCTRNGWDVEQKCPGGGSVACHESGGYELRCVDEKGRPWPFPAPSFVAKAGEPCERCDYCKTGDDDSCVCRRCTELAFDEELDQVLICSGAAVWEAHVTCAGGGQVGCYFDFHGDYWVHCLDEQGRETVVTTPSR
jgi:hypothetical protein